MAEEEDSDTSFVPKLGQPLNGVVKMDMAGRREDDADELDIGDEDALIVNIFSYRFTRTCCLISSPSFTMH